MSNCYLNCFPYCVLCILEANYCSISSTHVVVATNAVLYIWHYRTASRIAAPEFNAIMHKVLEANDR